MIENSIYTEFLIAPSFLYTLHSFENSSYHVDESIVSEIVANMLALLVFKSSMYFEPSNNVPHKSRDITFISLIVLRNSFLGVDFDFVY